MHILICFKSILELFYSVMSTRFRVSSGIMIKRHLKLIYSSGIKTANKLMESIEMELNQGRFKLRLQLIPLLEGIDQPEISSLLARIQRLIQQNQPSLAAQTENVVNQQSIIDLQDSREQRQEARMLAVQPRQNLSQMLPRQRDPYQTQHQEKVLELSRKIELLKSEGLEKESAIERLSGESYTLSNKIREINQLRQNGEELIRRLTDNNRRLQSQVREKQQIIQQLRQDYKALQRSNGSSGQPVNHNQLEMLRQRIHQLQKYVKDSREQIRCQDRHIQRLQQRNRELQEIKKQALQAFSQISKHTGNIILTGRDLYAWNNKSNKMQTMWREDIYRDIRRLNNKVIAMTSTLRFIFDTVMDQTLDKQQMTEKITRIILDINNSR